ncbi:MAG TPA: PAS domain S-box protein [Pyrinomonadaceae bacterium]|nr:PAS domain S-box protein [Pyrinomonadaceae bacterium]
MHSANHSNNGRRDDSILIVNDVPEQLRLMDSLLRKAGYSVMTAEDGLEAFQVAKRQHPDVVISDVSMPHVNGIEFCRLIRQDSELRSVPILLVSAHRKDTNSVVEGLASGADDYLELPFDSTRLVAKVSRLLERAKLEASYRDLVEQASDIIFTLDKESRLTSINASGAHFLGREQRDLLGTSFAEAFGTKSQSGYPVAQHKQLADNEVINPELSVRDAMGRARWLEIVTTHIIDRLGVTIGVRGVARDITDRKRMEVRLRDSEERYRLLFESTPQPIWVYDEATLNILAVNEATIRTYGYTEDEFLSMKIDDLLSNESDPTLLIKGCSGSDEPVLTSPWTHRRKDRSLIFVELTSHPLSFNGKAARLVIANDVTERKLLDEKQRRMQLSLQTAAMEWRQTFNAIDFPVLIVDLLGRIKRLNQAAEDIAGLGSEDVIGREISELGLGEPWRMAAGLIRRVRENGTARSIEVTDESSAKTWAITLYSINEFGSAGERAILIAQDITKKTELEASLRQSEMMSLLGSLVAGVAHEVRNPLFGISSILDAFETRFSDRQDYLRYTNVLRDEVGRLTVLMEELLDYGRPAKSELVLSPVDDVIAKCQRACLPVAEVAQVKIINNVRGPLPDLMIDRRRLFKVFVNLIENAIQHSAVGGVVSISVNDVVEGNLRWIDCQVLDYGPGIREEDLTRIFEPFFSKRRGGTGLGLAIAHRIMDEHGGKLIAGNNPEGGACMTARFPVPPKEIDG